MTKEELEKEAENWLRKYLLCCNCEKKCNCIDSNSYCEEQVLKAYVDSAEPRERRIADLEDKLANADYQLEGRDNEIRELKAQIEKMKKYGKLLQDICVAMGNDPYMVWRGIEQRVLILWDKSEEAEGLKLAHNILDRLLEIKPQDWAEIEKWEIKEK